MRKPPSWQAHFRVEIAVNKDKAKAQEDVWKRRNGIRVYSDGSDYKGGVGSAAVLYRTRRAGHKPLQMSLGSASCHTVYEAELVGAILALELISRENNVRVSSIGLDNQAALRALRQRTSKPGHYLLDIFHARLNVCLHKHPLMTLTMRWVPGHIGIAGNERANGNAKSAAEGNSSTGLPRAVRVLQQSVSKLKQLHAEKLKRQAKEQWKLSKRHSKMSRIDGSLPSRKFLQLIGPLPRRHATLLFQLRTGHAPLQAHLHRIKKVQSPSCPACFQAPETVHHFLFTCTVFRMQRDQLRRELGRAALSISTLLTKPKAMKPLFRYIHRTARFADTFGQNLSLDDG